jgi:hypothetical protein
VAKTRKRLRRAADDQRLVRVVVRSGSLEGHVVAVSRDWCALRSADGDLAVLRVGAVRKLRRATAPSRGEPPAPAPALLDLYDVRSLLFTAGSLSPVLVVAVRGEADPVVGTVFRITKRYLVLGSAAEGTARVPLADVEVVRLHPGTAGVRVGVDHGVVDPG